MIGIPPDTLPEGYGAVWKALAREDSKVSSRQELAKRLKISTHTIQRILVDGDVPDLRNQKSRRLLHPWVRIITKLAVFFGKEPWEWLESIGVPRTEKIEYIVFRTAFEFSQHQDVPSEGRPGGDDSKAISEEAYQHLRMALDLLKKKSASHRPRKKETGKKSKTREKYCTSCLADLSVDENVGNSDQYCRHCSDENGRLRSRDEVLETIAEWFLQWQDDLTPEEARRRADLYMRSMPAWN
jgi:hypothetical protein